MKRLKNILIAAALLVSFSGKSQVCSGDYTWLVNGMNVTFFGTSSPNITNIVWDFGDGNFDYTNTLYANHTYATPGIYTACILYSDSTMLCNDSTCHVLVLDSCFGSFTYNMNGLTGFFYGSANGVGSNVVYQWNFGDNQTSTQQNPVHTYAQPGNYTVCFAYYDLSTGCSDSICYPVTTGGCFADFTPIDSMGYVFFINQSSLGSSGYYIWDYGDGSPTDNMFSPSHVFPTQGTYQVCLVAYDSAQNFCDSTCHQVVVTSIAGIHQLGSGELNVSLSPNPSEGIFQLNFSLTTSSDVSVSLFDLSGREVKQVMNKNFTAGQHSETINAEGMPSGTYFLRLTSNQQTTVCKLLLASKF